MGMSSSAIVTFGIDLGENIKFLEEFNNDFDAFLDTIGDYPKYGQEGYSYKNKEAYANKLGVEFVPFASWIFASGSQYALPIDDHERRFFIPTNELDQDVSDGEEILANPSKETRDVLMSLINNEKAR